MHSGDQKCSKGLYNLKNVSNNPGKKGSCLHFNIDNNNNNNNEMFLEHQIILE